MKIVNKKMFGEPFSAYGSEGKIKRIQRNDYEHTPYNKLRNEVESTLEFTVTRCPIDPDKPASGWVEISMTEITTSGKRTSGRTISTTLTVEDAMRLAKFIQTGE